MLTDKHCKNATCPPDKKRARFTDSGGLYLEVSPAGSKRWFCKLYADGKEGRMALGSYPGVGLADARKARDSAKLQKSEGADPVMVRKVEKLKASVGSGNTFASTAADWLARGKPTWSDTHYVREHRNIEKDLKPNVVDKSEQEIQELIAQTQRDHGETQTGRARAMFGALLFGPEGKPELDASIKENLDADSIRAFFSLVVGLAHVLGEGERQSERASQRHAENRAMKQDVFAWLDANMPNFTSMDAAAEAIAGKVAPIKFRTARDWVGEWKSTLCR